MTLIPFLPGVGWVQIGAGIVVIIGIAIYLYSLRVARSNEGNGRPYDFIGGAITLIGAAVGWITYGWI